MKTKMKRVTGAELLQLASTGAAITKVMLLNETSDRLECTYEITMEVDPTLEELIDELKEITDNGSTYGRFNNMGEYHRADDLVNEIYYLVRDQFKNK